MPETAVLQSFLLCTIRQEVAQVTSHPPQEQKTRVRIPPGYKILKEIIAMLMCKIDLICIVLCVDKDK
jgi:hypothetical protein